MTTEEGKILASIIIPVKRVNDYIFESVPKILELGRNDIEILIFTDEIDTEHTWPRTRIIASGVVGPAEKRDLALIYAKGDILAFIDDDAYPDPMWLEKTLPHFNDPRVGAVGGPAITPHNDGILAKASGGVFESLLGGGFTRNRYLPIGAPRPIDDWPTVNLLVRKDVFEKIGGFDTSYWPGEDTKLCLDIIEAGYTIMYEPDAIVYHHRRGDIVKHLKQIGNYGIHRGYFAKKYPRTSCKLSYFIPSFFVLYLLLLLMVIIFFKDGLLIAFFTIPLAIYIVGLLLDAIMIGIRWRSIRVPLITAGLIGLTHAWYGIRFMQGLVITQNLKSTLRK